MGLLTSLFMDYEGFLTYVVTKLIHEKQGKHISEINVRPWLPLDGPTNYRGRLGENV